MPLVGFAFQETVEAVEAALQRPLVVGAGRRGLEGRREVPLAGRESVIALQAQHFGQRASALGNAPAHAGKAQIPVGQPAHAHRMMIAPGQQRRPRRRAQGGGVEVGVPQAAGGECIDVRRRDFRAVAAQVGETEIVEHKVNHVGGARRRAGRGRPVRPGLIGGVAHDGAGVRFAHVVSSLSARHSSAAHRNPIWPVLAVGSLPLRAATRYR